MEQRDKAEFETLLQMCSDTYKDAYGVRPRHLYSAWRKLSLPELDEVLYDLQSEAQEAAREQAYQDQLDFELARLDYLFED